MFKVRFNVTFFDGKLHRLSRFFSPFHPLFSSASLCRLRPRLQPAPECPATLLPLRPGFHTVVTSKSQDLAAQKFLEYFVTTGSPSLR